VTSHTGRLYALAGSLFAFFVLWAVVAGHPWVSAGATHDPRLIALAQRERRLRADAAAVQRIVDRRYAAYKVVLAKRRSEIAAAQAARASAATAVPVYQASSSPGVRVVTLPPLVITKTS
jgi:hypothetical protein